LIVVLITAASTVGCAGSLNNAQGAGEGISPQTFAGEGTASPTTRSTATGFTHTAFNSSAYTIGPLDVLDISVFNVPELSKTVQVSGTGTINMPLLGEIPAAGNTTEQLERELTAKLGEKYLQNPQVTVLVKEYNSQRVTVEGAVKKPGVYPITTDTSLLQLVAMAGDFDVGADSTVLILRTTNGKRAAARFDVGAIQTGRAEDPKIQSGDVVVAGSSAIKKGFNTILRALPLAGVFALL
jgi:polysaccharide biosynthesis/export protein